MGPCCVEKKAFRPSSRQGNRWSGITSGWPTILPLTSVVVRVLRQQREHAYSCTGFYWAERLTFCASRLNSG